MYMNEKDKSKINYTSEQYTFAETLYNNHIEMRKTSNQIEGLKYDIKDKYILNEDFKQGFIAGIKIMSSLFLDL